jgi:hypothetical protein
MLVPVLLIALIPAVVSAQEASGVAAHSVIVPTAAGTDAAPAVTDFLTQYGWLPWVIVALIGAATGTTEIVAKYRDEPSRALTTKPAILYIVINALASVIALALIQQLDWTFSIGEERTDLTELTQLLVAGFGAMILLRAAVFTVRAPGKEDMIGPVNVLQTILDACDRAVDRKRAAARAESVTKLMKDIDFVRASVELPLVAIALLQNLSQDDETRLKESIKVLNSQRGNASNEGLCLSLGLLLLGVLGEDALKAAVATVRSRIKTTNDSAPAIDFLYPSTITQAALAEGTDIPLTVGGRHFDNSSKVLLDGQVQSTTFDPVTNQLRTALPVSLLQGSGEHAVTVFTRTNTGGESAAMTLLLEGAIAMPQLESIDPAEILLTAVAAGADVTLTASGRNFVSGASALMVDGLAQPKTVVSENRLTAQVPAAVLTAGEHQVTVGTTDAFGSDESAPLTLSVVATGESEVDAPAEPGVAFPDNVTALPHPAPVIEGIAPETIDPATVAAGGDVSLAVTGQQFVSESTIALAGQPQPTQFVDSTHLTAQVAATALATPGAYEITVVTPEPGGGASAAMILTVGTAGAASPNGASEAVATGGGS